MQSNTPAAHDSDPGPSAMSDPGPSAMSDPGPSAMSDPGPSAMSDPGPSAMSDPGPSAMSDSGPSAMSDSGPSAMSDSGPSAMSDSGPSATLDTFDPAMIARPHAFYAQLRENAPIVWIPQFNAWVLTRYDDVRSVLRDHEQWSSLRNEDRRFADIAGVKVESVAPRGTLDMLSSDRPDHTRLRKLLTVRLCACEHRLTCSRDIDAIVAELARWTSGLARPSTSPRTSPFRFPSP